MAAAIRYPFLPRLLAAPHLLMPALLLLFSAAMALFSTGFFEADETTHFLKARALWHDWRGILDIWGRPACTGLYGLAAPLALSAARLVAVGMTGLTGWGAVTLLRELKQRGLIPPQEGGRESGYFARNAAAWVWVLLYAQPLFLLNSFSVMTEMLLACPWIWAAVLVLRGRMIWAGLLIGLAGLARPEGWFAIVAWPFVVYGVQALACGAGRAGSLKPVLRTVVLASAAAILPMLAWWLAGTCAYHNPRWMIDYFPWQASSQYGKTGLLFLASALVSLAAWMWLPVVVGAVRLWRERRWPGLLLLAAPAGCFYLLHALMGSLGLMGAMSLPRYFAAVSPFVAILAVIGLHVLEQRSRRPRLMRKLVMAASLLPAFVLAAAGQLPVPETTDMRRLNVATTAFERRVGGIPPEQRPALLIAGHPYIYYHLGIPMDTAAQHRVFSREAMRTAPVGTVIITDAQLWSRERRPTPAELASWGYRLDEAAARDIRAVPERLDVTTLFRTGGEVALWVKTR